MRTSRVYRLLPMAALLTTILVAFACGPAAPAPTATKAPVTAAPTPTTAPAPTPTVAAAVKRGGEFSRIVALTSPGYDIDFNQQITDLHVNASFYSSLLRMKKDGGVEPDMATSWEVLDGGKRWVFHLNPNLKFSDGSPLTSEDVVWSFDKMAGKVEGHGRAIRIGAVDEYIDSKQANDPQTVTFNLKWSAPAFPLWVAQDWAGITRKGTTREQLLKQPYGAGPFRFKEEVAGSHAIGEKNPYYYKAGLPYVDTIKFQKIADNTARYTAMVTGKADFHSSSSMPSVDMDKVLRATKGLDYSVRRHDSPSTFVFNLSKDTPFKDVRVRKAVDLTIDRQAFINVSRPGGAIVGLGWPADWPTWGRPLAEVLARPGINPATKQQDIARAKELMAEAGFANGFDTVFDTSSASATVDFYVLELAKIGIRAKVNIFTINADVYYQQNKHTLSTGAGWTITGDPDERYLTLFITNGSRNVSHYSNPEVDRLIPLMSAETDLAKRVQLQRQLEDIILTDLPQITVSYGLIPYVYRDYVRGADPGFNIYQGNRFDTVWLDK